MVGACCMHYVNREREREANLKDTRRDGCKKNSEVCTRNGGNTESETARPVNISERRPRADKGSILPPPLFHPARFSAGHARGQRPRFHLLTRNSDASRSFRVVRDSIRQRESRSSRGCARTMDGAPSFRRCFTGPGNSSARHHPLVI